MPLRPSSTRNDEVRKKCYKTGVVDAEETRRRREDNLVGIRKSKREESLLKKRREGFFFLNQNLYQQQFSEFSKNVRIHKKVFLFSDSGFDLGFFV